jgi:hypothetical protein
LICDNTRGPARADTGRMLDQNRLQEVAQLNDLLRFARDIAVSEEVAIAVYESELRHLHQGAKVKRYVSLLAEKRAKQVLKARRR